MSNEKKNYWDDKVEKAINDWKTANRIQQFRLYNELQKPIRYMANSILGRYFSYNYSDKEELIQSAINHLFCNLDKYDIEKKSSSYSFCGTVLRRYFMDVVRQKKRLLVVQLEYYDNNDLETQFEYSYVFNPLEEEKQYDFSPVFQRLENARYRLLTYLASKPKCGNQAKKGIGLETQFLTHTIEFLHAYKDSQGLSGCAILENTLGKTKMSIATANKFMKKHLGVTAMHPDLRHPHEANNKIDWLQDDYMPNERRDNISKRRMRLVKNE
jgi:DNA-directed RNA polymerase specialized sigma24 family protein